MGRLPRQRVRIQILCLGLDPSTSIRTFVQILTNFLETTIESQHVARFSLSIKLVKLWIYLYDISCICGACFSADDKGESPNLSDGIHHRGDSCHADWPCALAISFLD